MGAGWDGWIGGDEASNGDGTVLWIWGAMWYHVLLLGRLGI
jgi:hypothetical protein